MADGRRPEGPEYTQEWRPIPDPTKLTTDAVNRLETIITQRFEAFELLFQSKIDAAVQLSKEKFAEVERRFGEMEHYRQEQKRDTKDQVDYALNAVNERLIQLGTNATTVADSLRRSIEENKERTTADATIRGQRVTAVEQRIVAMESQKTGARDNTAWIAAAVGVVLLVLALMGWIASHNLQ